MSEVHHCFKHLDPYVHSLFLGPLKNYDIRFDRTVNKTKTRSDIACVVDGTPIMISEIKPPKYTPLQKKKDFVKVNLRAKESVNEQLVKKGGPGEVGILINMGMFLYY